MSRAGLPQQACISFAGDEKVVDAFEFRAYWTPPVGRIEPTKSKATSWQGFWHVPSG
jgi:hypothetical protein